MQQTTTEHLLDAKGLSILGFSRNKTEPSLNLDATQRLQAQTRQTCGPGGMAVTPPMAVSGNGN